MSIIEFNPEKQFSAADQERLAKAAERKGMTVSEFVEFAVKSALFSEANRAEKGGLSS